MPVTDVPVTDTTGHRERLLDAITELAAERGYAAVTVADVVGRARMSKRTFYQHFPGREECFLAAYVAAAQRPLHRMAAAAQEVAGQPLSLRDRVAAGAAAYLDAMAHRPGLTRTLLTEVLAVGPAGWQVRREVLGAFAAALVAQVEQHRRTRPEVAQLPAPVALALVGGINELVLDAIESGRGDRLGELLPTVTDLVTAVLDRTR